MSRPAALFKLTRFPLVFTAAADSAVGAALAGADLLHSTAWIPAAVASSFFYAGGMVMNDVVDAQRDRTLHPERPIPSGRVSVRAAAIFAAVLFALGLLAARNIWIVPAVLVALIVAYNAFLKRWAVPGSLGMAAVRGANLAMGWAAVGLAGSLPWISLSILAAYVFILTLWSTQEDRADGSRGLLGVLGIGLVVIPFAGAVMPGPARWAAAIPAAWIFPWVRRALARPEPSRLMQVVRWGVLGIIPLDASFLATQGRWAEAAGVAALIVPALVLLPLFRRL